MREEKRNPAADKTFHGEMARHMESLKDHGQNIEVGELLNMVHENDKHRIFFVGGVAGIGKSVLAKRIAYDWSCNENFLRVSLMDRESFDEDNEVSYQLLQVLSDGDKLRTSPAGRLITRKDAQNIILDILNKVDKVGEIEDGGDQFLLKLRFISDCLEATDKVGDTSFLRNLLHTITPSSSFQFLATSFEQQNLSTILRLAKVSSAANLFGLAEWVKLIDVRVGGKEFEKIIEKVIQIKPRRLRLMELDCCPLVNHDLKQKMKENGVGITEEYKRNNAELAIGLNRTIPAIMDSKFIVISNAPGNQVEANEMKQKFANEIGCPVCVNIELEKYIPGVVVVLLTDGYEESQQCKEMMNYYVRSLLHPKIIAVKLDNDFQPGDELNKIVRESTCICWTDKTNFDTNFAKVKEEINAEFASLIGNSCYNEANDINFSQYITQWLMDEAE
eukprot:gene6505-biopygen5299